MKNLIQRTVTGIVFIAMLIACILCGKFSFGILFMAITALALWEFHQLTNEKCGVQINKAVAAVCGAVLFACLFAVQCWWLDWWILGIYLLLVIAVLIAELYRKKQNPVLNWAFFTLGQLYIALPFACLNFIPFARTDFSGDYGAGLLLAFFVTIWINDTGAYVTGMTLGRHRIFERISPKKSWEGFFGGLVFSFGSAYVFSLFETSLSLLQWLGFSVIIVTFATFGDLSESLLKRTIGVKDSGNILPGHGGILDRFDSILFASIAISIYLQLI
jgi:phosphatidate cytidylyltransferase